MSDEIVDGAFAPAEEEVEKIHKKSVEDFRTKLEKAKSESLKKLAS